jgi:hypothetical protein
MTRVRRASTGWLVAGALLVALLLAQWQRREQTEPTIRAIAGMGSATFEPNPDVALERMVDRLGFPEASGGFHAIGGTTFEIAGREGASVVWARGEQRMTYSILAGTDHVEARELWGDTQNVSVRGESRDLNWGNGFVYFKRDERTVVITGSPPSASLRRAMRALATAS